VAAEHAAFGSSISARVDANKEAVMRYDSQIKDATGMSSQVREVPGITGSKSGIAVSSQNPSHAATFVEMSI